MDLKEACDQHLNKKNWDVRDLLTVTQLITDKTAESQETSLNAPQWQEVKPLLI